jgi:hypothetical protein
MQSLSKSLKKQNVLEDRMKQASIFEYLSAYSVEHLFAYLRFQAFPERTNEEMKELLFHAMSVPCRENPILEKFLEYAEKKDFNGLLLFIKNNKVTSNQGKLLKDPMQMLDIFFSEGNQHDATRALKVLLRFPIYNNDPTAYNEFVKKWPEVKDPEMKESNLQLFDHTELIV